MWQKCPICNGTGFTPEVFEKTVCPVCNGKKIISTLTGLPPAYILDKPLISEKEYYNHAGINNNFTSK